MEAEVGQGHPVDDWKGGPVSLTPTSTPPGDPRAGEEICW